MAPTLDEKTQLITAYGSYPWGPGEVMRYKSSETMLLAMAMDNLIRQREGDAAGLWRMMSEEVFAPLGIGPIPTRMALGIKTRRRVPRFDGGMLPTYQGVL